MYAPQIFQETRWRNSEISNLSQESLAVFDEIFIMLEQIKTEKVNNYRAVWLRAYRGSLADMAFDDQEEALEYFGISDPGQLQEAFQKEYPDKIYWFNLESVNEGSYRHLRLRNFGITIVQDDLNGYPHNCTNLLTWIRDNLAQVLEEIQNGEYNLRVQHELPLSLRYKALLRDRPGWTAMLEECGKDDIKTIVIPAFSMLSQNYNDTLSAVRCLKRNGEINILFLLENSFSATDEGQMQMQLQCILYGFVEIQKDEKRKLRRIFKEVLLEQRLQEISYK